MDSNTNKIQYFTICTSVSLGGKSLYSKREEEENFKIMKDQTVWKKEGSNYDDHKLEKVITQESYPNYTLKGKINIQLTDFDLPTKQKVIDDIQNFFNNSDFDASLLIISGYGGQVLNKGIKESYFVLYTSKGDEHVSYLEVSNLWLNRTSKEKNKKLLIVIDVPNSGCWVTECKELLHFESIAVQSSSGTDESANNIKGQGGILIHNFLELNGKNMAGNIHISKSHTPMYAGFFHEIRKIFNLQLMFSSWEEFQKTEILTKSNNEGVYEGVIVDKKKHGPGVLKYHNGDIYQGQWENDQKHGYGIMVFSTTEKYIGNWKNDKFHGRGVYYYMLDNHYEGDFVDGFKHGKGTYYYANGNRYEGEYKDDKNEGVGILYFKSGNKYEGTFSGGKKNGKGVFSYSDGGKYEGNLKNDKFCGYGVFYFNNGNKYDGEFLEGKKNGKGVFEYKSGNKYDGDWKDDKFSGTGHFWFKTGDEYIGEFKDGVFSGIGTYIYKDTDKYEGEWKQDQKNGKGKIFYKNGDRFEGIFKNGKRNGKGTYFSKDGIEKVGKWKDDELC